MGSIRYLTAGESHGKALVTIVEGLPAGIPITVEEIQNELSRRRLGYGRGPRMRFEKDEVTILGGVRFGRTLGAPVAIEIGNTEWPKWETEMSVAPGSSTKPLTAPRPGHADLSGMLKYGFSDARDVLERASARETAAKVAAGICAKKFLQYMGIEILSHVVSIGEVIVEADHNLPRPEDLDAIDSSPVRCFFPDYEEKMVAAIKAASKEGDSLGGTVEAIAIGVPVGLGSHVHWDRRIDGLFAQALMGIQAVKAVEIGDGFSIGKKRGSLAHDSITWDSENRIYKRATDRAGGIEGGITTGEPIVLRATMKPLATLN
ncbi:MAG: chorismate synthase, partial [Acidimicrobiales bacterium]|nr:chorismate synthase [Acidimicrobiales bacterium]